jgi:hypothetical protein
MNVKRITISASLAGIVGALVLALLLLSVGHTTLAATGVTDPIPGQVQQVAIDMDPTNGGVPGPGNSPGTGGATLLGPVDTAISVPLNTTQTVDIVVDEIAPADGNATGFSYTLNYNPAIVSINGHNPAPSATQFMVTGGLYIVPPPDPDFTGAWTDTYGTFGAGSHYGEGVLDRIGIKCGNTIGSSMLTLTDGQIFTSTNTNGDPSVPIIPGGGMGATIYCGEAAPTPPPPTPPGVGTTPTPSPPFQSQPANKSSGLVTADNKRVWDDEFAKWIKDNIPDGGYKNLTFVFGQCFGGGMIDELMRQNVAAFSASRHDQTSRFEETKEEHASRLHTTVAQLEAAYHGQWPSYVNPSPESGFLEGWVIGAQLNETLQQIFDFAFWFDPFGPHGDTPREEPQARYQPEGSKNVKLHDGTSNHVILYAGDAHNWADWNDVNRVHDILTEVYPYHYSEDEITVLYGNKLKPDGSPTPAWVDGTGKKADLKAAIEALKGKMNANETLLFWSTDHGDMKKRDVTKADPVIAALESHQILFQLDQAFVDPMTEPEVLANTSGVTSSTNEVLLNGQLIGYLDPSVTDQMLSFDRNLVRPGDNELTIVSTQATDFEVNLSMDSGACQRDPAPAPIGGITALTVSSSGSSVPWVPLAAVAAGALAVLGAGLWYDRRRWSRKPGGDPL